MRASQALDDISQQCVPPGHGRERLRLRCARVVALAYKSEKVLAEVIGQSDDGNPARARLTPSSQPLSACN